MRTPADLPRRLPRASRRLRIGLLVGVVVLVLLLLSLRSVASFWTDYLWFDEVGFTSVFRGVLVTKVLLALVFTVLFFLLLLANLALADRFAPKEIPTGPEDELPSRYREIVAPHRRAVHIVTALVFGLFSGVGTNGEWNNWDLLRYHVNFGVTDPEYHKDVGFYVFELPFIRFLLSWLFISFIVTLIVTAVAHYLNGGIRFQGQGPRVTGAVKTHLSVLLGVLALIKGIDYYFQRLELVLSTKHVVDGATATSLHADKPAKTLLIAIAVIAAGLFLYNIRQKGWTLPIVAVALWALVWILVGGVYPALYQAVRVAPSELTRERPYIARNIAATQASFGINNVQTTQNYAANAVVNPTQISGATSQAQANQQTISNIRLLDPNQLSHTFDKFQAVRTYFSFNNLNPDRYVLSLGGQAPQLTQTITSVRELNNQVPSGFVNQHLVYTHGYGAVVAPAGQGGVNSDGTPNFSLENLPPTGAPALGTTPQVYYGVGQETGGYVVAHSKQPELDYENGSGAQVQTSYAGTGGVAAGGFFRRAAFALRFGDPNLILSGQVTSNSRIMYIRNIANRVRKAAPFLSFDSDPYSVIISGHIYWVQDAYTTTSQYPYAQQADTTRVPPGSGLSGTFNYVRNSVKVVIDAYDGSMHYFVTNTNDPIIKVYERAFPDLLIPVSQAEHLIPGITSHFRYPEDLFRVQTNMFGRYHLSDPSEFYNQGFAWTTSQDPGSGTLNQIPLGQALTAGGTPVLTQSLRFQPQYLLAHLPNTSEQSFMILQPFVPVSPSDKQQNLTAFMTASSDPSDYGTLRVYETPPNVSVDGPALINNAIRSNNAISSELTLLNQGGSQVELGQVNLVPIDQTLLYVEPIYVESSSNQVPTLKDVVVVYNGTAYNSGNASLDAALCRVTNVDQSKPFGQYCTTPAATSTTPGNSTAPATTPGPGAPTPTTVPATSSTTVAPPPTGQTVQQLLTLAQQAFAAASQALKSGDLATYQKQVNLANQFVTQAQQLAASNATTPTGGPATSVPATTVPPTTVAPSTTGSPTTIGSSPTAGSPTATGGPTALRLPDRAARAS